MLSYQSCRNFQCPMALCHVMLLVCCQLLSDYGMKIQFYGGSDFQKSFLAQIPLNWVLVHSNILHPSNHPSLLCNRAKTILLQWRPHPYLRHH